MARVQVFYAALMVLLVALYALVPMVRGGVVVTVGVFSVTAIELGVRRLRPPQAGAWRLLAAAVAVLGLHVFLLLLEATLATPPRYPGGTDVLVVVGLLLLSVALFWLGRPVPPERDGTSLIDAIILTLAGALIVWVALVRPAVETRGFGTAERVSAVVAIVVYLGVLAATARLVLGQWRNTAVILLAVATLLFLGSEPFHRHLGANPPAAASPLVNLGYLALATGCGGAALSRSISDLRPPGSGQHTLRPLRLALIAAGLLVAPALLAIDTAGGRTEAGLGIAVGCALVSVLVLVRLWMSGRAYRLGAAREHAARVASQAMVSAVNPADVLAGTRSGLRSIWPTRGEIGLDLVQWTDADRPSRTVLPPGDGGRSELAVPLSGAESAFVFSAPPRVLDELADLFESLADQAAVALQRIHLAAVASAEERDRYFRTLVLTSTDAILITRDGHIAYATPSAQTMFGRDVVREDFDEIVRPAGRRPDTGDQWPKSIDGAEGIIRRPEGDATVLIQRRDLSDDPTVRGIVTTLRDVTDERELQRDLAYRASHDELTGMANTRAWSEIVSSEKDRRRGPGNGVAVIFIDLDDFKQINDRYGHPAGDRVLADMARRIRACVRAGDVAARVGGDEFAVLLRGLPDIADARSAAQRLAEALARPALVHDTPIECKASIGLSYTEGQERIDTLIRQADTALYAAKEQGKGRWTEYDPKQWAPPRTTHNGGLSTVDAMPGQPATVTDRPR